jgi:allantoinase
VPGNASDLAPLLDAGVLGFKVFLVASGIDEFPQSSREDLEAAMPILAKRGVPLLVHAELPGPIEMATAAVAPGSDAVYQRYLETRPPSAEVAAVELVTELAEVYGGPIHIVHVSAAEVGPVLHEARAGGVRVTAETCPHYLTFDAEVIPDGATEYKCAPPIRDAFNRQMLWHLLETDGLDLIATDHSPCPPSLKCLDSGDFRAAWGGIASLELSLSTVWTMAARRGNDLSDLVRWMCQGPAKLAGLQHTKGRIAPGYDADLVVFDPDEQWQVDPELLHQRHHLTPYAGRTLRGRVLRTFLRGEEIFAGGVVVKSRPGRWLKREGS